MAKEKQRQAKTEPVPRSVVSVLDRAPPQDLEAESALVGSLLAMPTLIDEVAVTLTVNDFHDESFGAVFRALLELHENGDRIDEITLVSRLKKHGMWERVGGAAALARIIGSAPSAYHAAYYASLVRERSVRRQLLFASEEALRDVHDDALDCETILARHETRVMALADRSIQRPLVTGLDLCRLTLESLDARITGKAPDGLATGFRDLDRMTGGMRGGQLWVLAARPGMGKSAFALNLAENVAVNDGKTVLICSLEMSDAELGERLLSSMSGVSAHRMRDGSISDEERARIIEQASFASQAPIVVYDESSQGVRQVGAVARRQKRKSGLSLLIVDYLQLLEPEERGKNDNREQQVARMTRRLKQLARELSCPVLVLAQLNRQAEDGRDNKPRLKHLRESGAIEQDADLVLFVHREEYYTPSNDDVRGKAELIVAKQRNGPVGEVPLTYQRECMRFRDRAPDRHRELDAFNERKDAF